MKTLTYVQIIGDTRFFMIVRDKHFWYKNVLSKRGFNRLGMMYLMPEAGKTYSTPFSKTIEI
jgi:hypothetical protein